MIKENYANAYKEVLVILNSLVKEDYDKIPKDYIEFLSENCNNNHEFYYNSSKSLKEQEVLDETKYIIFGLFEKFGATESQKEKIKNFKENYYQKIEKEKEEKYNPDNIFNNNKSIVKNLETKENELVDIPKIKWYKKIWNALKKFFIK